MFSELSVHHGNKCLFWFFCFSQMLSSWWALSVVPALSTISGIQYSWWMSAQIMLHYLDSITYRREITAPPLPHWLLRPSKKLSLPDNQIKPPGTERFQDLPKGHRHSPFSHQSRGRIFPEGTNMSKLSILTIHGARKSETQVRMTDRPTDINISETERQTLKTETQVGRIDRPADINIIQS